MPGFNTVLDHRIDICSVEEDLCMKKHTMPVDFQSYLLAASPPGFDLHYAIRDHYSLRTEDQVQAPSVISATKHVSAFGNPWNNNFGTKAVCVLTPHEECAEVTNEETKPSELTKKPSQNGLGKLPKRVSFADDLGGPLVQVRILSARPESPPLLHPEILSSLTNGSSAEVTDLPPIKLNFSQPASDYIAFRNKLDNNCVALENVILKDYDLAGTVKVKNVAFEKKVFIRYTTDCWETFTDVSCVYVPTGNLSGLPYDTFSFEIHISPKMDVSKKLLFAVMYLVNNRQYWDNNDGDNFEVVSSTWKEDVIENHNTTDTEVYNAQQSDTWTKFCGWHNMSESVPYY